MKHKLLPAILLGCIFTISSSKADPNTGEKISEQTAKTIRIQIEYYELSLVTLSNLMEDAKTSSSDQALRTRIKDLVKKDAAKLINMHVQTINDGEKAMSESIREFIYPTEYEPPELPNTIHAPAGGQVKGAATGPTPTAFETRNLGENYELEASINENQMGTINLRFAPEHTKQLGFVTYVEWKDSRSKADIVMPDIYTLRITGALQVNNGKPALIGTLSAMDEKGKPDPQRKLIVFIKASIIANP